MCKHYMHKFLKKIFKEINFWNSLIWHINFNIVFLIIYVYLLKTYYRNNGIKARLGEWNAQATTEPNPYVEISVSKVTLHFQYNSQNLENDIAVLKLSSVAPIAISPNINTACLPTAATAAGTRHV